MASPWFTYTTQTRAALLAAASSETYSDDVADVAGLEIGEPIVNVQEVTPGTKYIDGSGYAQTNAATGTVYASDRASVAQFSPHVGSAISSSLLENKLSDASVQQALADAIVAGQKDPHPRPQMLVTNRWPSQLTRQLGDVITLTFARQRIYSQPYSILSLETRVDQAAQEWTTRYILEELP